MPAHDLKQLDLFAEKPLEKDLDYTRLAYYNNGKVY
jgi:hypothetical protein